MFDKVIRHPLIIIMVCLSSGASGFIGGCTLLRAFGTSLADEHEAWSAAGDDILELERQFGLIAHEYKQAVEALERAKHQAGRTDVPLLLNIVAETGERLKLAGVKLDAAKEIARQAKDTYDRRKAAIEAEGGGWQETVGGILGSLAGIALAYLGLKGPLNPLIQAAKPVLKAIDNLKETSPATANIVLDKIREVRPGGVKSDATNKAQVRFKRSIEKLRSP